MKRKGVSDWREDNYYDNIQQQNESDWKRRNQGAICR